MSKNDNFHKPLIKLQTVHSFPALDIYYRVWQYRLWSFQIGGTKLERFFPKNQHTQRKLLDFENRVNGEVSKIGNHFKNQIDLKLMLSKTKNIFLN